MEPEKRYLVTNTKTGSLIEFYYFNYAKNFAKQASLFTNDKYKVSIIEDSNMCEVITFENGKERKLTHGN
jgi:hypothetical protein